MDFISQISALACSSSSTHVVRVNFSSFISASKDSQETHGKEPVVSNKAILLLATSRLIFKETQELRNIEAFNFNKSNSD
jgi:hypothetical protein